MKKTISTIVKATLGLTMAIGIGVAASTNNKNAARLDAAEEVYKTVEFVKGNCTTATGAYTATAVYNDDIEVNCVNFNTNAKDGVPQWDFIRCGRKNNVSVGEIVTTSSIDAAITKVRITIDNILDTSVVNSIKLYSSSNGTSWTEEDSYSVATGAQDASIASPAANLYYKAVFDCKSHTANGIIQVSKIEYYYQNSGPSLSVSPTSAIIAKNGSQTLTATANNGSGSVSWITSDSTVASISAGTGASIVVTGEKRGTAVITASYSTAANVDVSIQVTDVQHDGSLGSPYTVEDARDQIDLNTGLTNVYVTGIVSEIVTPFNSQYGNISYNISSDGLTTSEQLQAYRGKSFNGDSFAGEDDIEVGATVVVYGTITKYNSTYEFTADNQLKTYTPAPRYTVSFNSLGGTSVDPIQNIKKGASVETLPEVTKAKDTEHQKRFEFVGWYIVDDPSNIVFEEENRFTTSTAVNNNVTVYAKYNEINYFVVSFDTDGGTQFDSQEIDNGGFVSMPNNPTKAADSSYTYTFEGWYTNAGLTDPFDDSEPVTSNMTLYAKYTAQAVSNPGSYVNLANSVATIHGSETPAEEESVSKTINELVEANSWSVSSGTNINGLYTSFELDENIDVSTTGTPNCGSVWGTSTHDWRLYQNQAGDVTIASSNGYKLSSVTFSYNVKNGGTLVFNEENISSGTKVNLSGTTATFTVGNTGSATNGQTQITSISVEYQKPVSVSNVVMRFGASIAKSDWDAINNHDGWEITDYGVMFLKEATLNGYGKTSVEAAFKADMAVTIKHKGSGTAPYLDGANYLFTIKVSIPATYYGDVICAVPFIKVNDQYYFMEEKHESVNSLATYYRANGGSDLSNDALDYLKTAN